MSSNTTLPDTPVKHADFISYVAANPNESMQKLLQPYKDYDAKLREVFAQQPHHPVLADQHLNITPVFNGSEKDVQIRARPTDTEEDEKYVMPLSPDNRLPSGAPAIVGSIKDFKENFSLFSELSLVDLDWSNVVAAGSSVVTCLLPVPNKFKESKRALRQYYHETIAPASDVDLFLYGLSEEQATKKIIQIEKAIKDSILTETTTIRTKNAITIASQYPTRHVQIVLRVYKSVSEILTGFDVDSSCVAYDGEQVWAAPRAISAYMTQCNTIDLTRRSPSYENRLSKYSHRGFEIYWPLLDRSRIDPTIFERNFARTVGLARLLVLERLPTSSERESYMDQRRRERGRPPINRNNYNFSMQGNIKEQHEDEVAEWVDQEDVSDYHTFTIPYGPKFHARKIEKLLYTKDLLLNAEWNKREDREVNLHRHPAFFGHAEDVIHDCCGFCPAPVTPEEHDVAEEEAKIYVSGEISYIKDDPGRQAIGSFNPITDDDWTEMAYVGNTARLCQAIIDGDLEHVEDWLSQEDSDPNTRDYTGRTPLHLAAICSTPEIVKQLIDHGARLVARLADGRTALHLAAARGNAEIVRMIMRKSEENEEEEAKKEDMKKKARAAARDKASSDLIKGEEGEKGSKSAEDSDVEMIDKEDSDDEMQSMTTSDFVKIKKEETGQDDLIPEEDEDDPDVYDVNVLAWDTQASPLHLAILNGHVDVVKELVSNFGADVLLPIKLLNSHNRQPRGAILTLVLALHLPLDKAKAMTKALLEIGASSAQSNMKQVTALHHVAGQQPDLVEVMIEHDEPAARRAINHLAMTGSDYSPSAQSPLMTALRKGNALAALKLLECGANVKVDFEEWMKSVEVGNNYISRRDATENHKTFAKDVDQPVVLAVKEELPELAFKLVSRGADPNTLPKETQACLFDNYYLRYTRTESLLDLVRSNIKKLKEYKDEEPPSAPKLLLKEGIDYLEGIEPNSYKYFIAKMHLEGAQTNDKHGKERYQENLETYKKREGVAEKQKAIDDLASEYMKLENELIHRGAKTFRELYPDLMRQKEKTDLNESYNRYDWSRNSSEDKEKDWEVKYRFDKYDLTEEMKEGYLKLFEAAWKGDLDTIKSLTLSSWGPEGDQKPLQIAIQDKDHMSPFSIAVLRGHLDTARSIVDISFAQYHPSENKEKARYRMADDDEEDEEDSDYESQSSGDVMVYKELIDDQFTIENIGEVSNQVKSQISPSSFMSWTTSAWAFHKMFHEDFNFRYGSTDQTIERNGTETPIQWAIIKNDIHLFTFLLELQKEWTRRLANKEEDGYTAIPSLTNADFSLALEFGRLQILAEMIKFSGAGMKLDSLVKRSGVKYEEPPKYYQGLSVHGKKRADWVAAAQGIRMHSVTDTNPPLLRAAKAGNLESVEWFLNDAPARHYAQFAEVYHDDKLIKHLNKAAGGFDKTLHKFLGARRELVIHVAVLAKPDLESDRLLDYLIKAFPNLIDKKSSQGHTPLALAFSLKRLKAAKKLLAAGANQTVRDYMGNNILHLLLASAYGSRVVDAEKLRPFLDLIDKRLVPSLLVEKSRDFPYSVTPLARWMNTYPARYNAKVMKTLLDWAEQTGNEHLELFDGTGDTPVHMAVKWQSYNWLKLMLEHRPDLLYRENATGRTPFEMAEDAYTSDCVTKPMGIENHSYTQSIINRHASDFVSNKIEANDTVESIWRLCADFREKHPGKRRLVSLLDANEVANRLTQRHGSRQTGNNNDDDSDVEDDDIGDTMDEVAQWYYSGADYSE